MTTDCTATNGQFACTLLAHHAGTHIDNYTWHGFPRRGAWADGDGGVAGVEGEAVDGFIWSIKRFPRPTLPIRDGYSNPSIVSAF